MIQQVEFFDRFRDMVLRSAVMDEYQNLKRVKRHHEMERELLLYETGRAFLSPNSEQKSFSINEEAALLRESRDTKEELNIIQRIQGQ
jgi:hypothetical protein